MANAYYRNNVVRISGAFTVNAVATDPTTVTLKVIDPNGVEATYTYAGAQVVRDSTGNYHYDLVVATDGLWLYEWTGTGTCIAASQGNFNVVGVVFL